MATTKTRAGGGGEEEEEEEDGGEEEEIITNNSAANENKSNSNIMNINNDNKKVGEGKEDNEEEEEEVVETSSGGEKGGRGGGGEGQEEEEEEDQRWGTWEELLLACAVKRHGFKAWDSVSMELQTRTTLPPPLTSPRHCQLKYNHLKRRFTFNTQDSDPDPDPDPDQDPDSLAIPWLHHLRELRVAELRRELREYDDSIQSLQRTVKRLEEEREQSQSLSSKENQRPDLADSSREDRSLHDKTLAETKPPKSALRSATGEESDRENRSVNESNSTGVKSEREREGDEIGIEEAEKKPEVVAEAKGEAEAEAEVEGKGTGSEWKPEGMESYNGSSESKRKRSSEGVADSVEERKEEEENRSSDVESSASLTKRKRKGRRIAEDEAEAEAEPLTDVKFQPLDDLLTKIRAHQHSSLFQRRLPIQESDKYQNIVRQPMDLDAIRKKLRRGSYASCILAFYRDLLLLFNNALVFYPKSSLESTTAHELMRIVLPEIQKKTTKQPSPSTTLRQDTSPSALKPELDRSDSLLAKHKSSAPIIVCRKRSSISAKPSSSTFGQKAEPRNEEKKHTVDSRPPAKPASSSASPQEQNLIKINTKERSITGTRSLRRSSSSSNNNKNIKTTPAPPAPSAKKQGSTPTSGSTDKADTPKGDQKKSEAVSSTKKRSAADFLKRIKRNSPVGKAKNSGDDPNPKGSKGGSGGGGGEQKKKHSGKAEKGEEKGGKQSGGGGGNSSGGTAKHGREETASSPSKKNVGRPPKKGAEPPKRGREDGGKESLKRPRKRSRR